MSLIAFTWPSDERPLYKRDVLNLLALRQGWYYTLTYSQAWVDPDIWTDLGNNRFAGRWLLVVLCGNAPQTLNDPFGIYLPIRWCRIVRTTHIGDVCQLILELKQRAPEQELERCSCALPIKDQPRSYLINSPLSDSGVEPTWGGQIAQALATQELKGLVGFRIEAFDQHNRSRKKAHAEPVTAGWDDLSGYPEVRLRSGSTYGIVVRIWDGQKAKEPLVQLKVSGNHLTVSERLLRLFSTEAQLTYLFAAERRYAAEFSTLVLGPAANQQAGEIQLLLRIGPPKHFWLAIAAGLGVASALTQFDPSWLPSGWVPSAIAPIVKAGMRTLGLLFGAIVLWRGFRRLPGGL